MDAVWSVLLFLATYAMGCVVCGFVTRWSELRVKRRRERSEALREVVNGIERKTGAKEVRLWTRGM